MTYQPHATPEPLATDTREALPVVAWMYTHKISGANHASDWRWHGVDAARQAHDETALCRLSDAEAEIARLRADAERMDWLIERGHIVALGQGSDTQLIWCDNSMTMRDLRGLWVDDVHTTDVRAAIDKARSATSGEAT